MKYCTNCGKELTDDAVFCTTCGFKSNAEIPVSHPKSQLTAAILCAFLGTLGIHRFYVGKIGTGLLWLFTGGMFGFGFVVDMITILCDAFTDINGNWLAKKRDL
ncbi:MAG: TM2 domain-containing protein [Clostridia bacterium]|nr:TM2 domain-containing protein [Clostridia bacterium]